MFLIKSIHSHRRIRDSLFLETKSNQNPAYINQIHTLLTKKKSASSGRS
jgi:hypothetical protein